ncbi:hypothetical protein GW17_00026602 [Ensete ventricosum]|nr:hypothetical protein GW17_00026602 [Ensete ventricosum]
MGRTFGDGRFRCEKWEDEGRCRPFEEAKRISIIWRGFEPSEPFPRGRGGLPREEPSRSCWLLPSISSRLHRLLAFVPPAKPSTRSPLRKAHPESLRDEAGLWRQEEQGAAADDPGRGR